MKNNKVFITHEEAKHICDKAQYGEASLWERVKLNIRLSWCTLSRKYTANNRKLTKVLNQNSIKLGHPQKDNLKSTFEKELAKQNNK